MNYEWAPSLVSALVTVIVTLAGVIGYLKVTGTRNSNGCVKLDKEFHDQVGKCNAYFIEIAEERGSFKTSLGDMTKQLDRIEGRLKRRRAV
ncbi:hypothetical protein MUP77_00550 [Candidatus Bathyarchaeota archaeon]|nr:hypothetical protein [Candidatus Bathyarchaeota archaeon]